MKNTPASRAAAAAAVTLAVMVGLVILLVMQASGQGNAKAVLLPLLGLALTCSIILHLVFVGILAQRLGRRPTWYVLGALLTLPIGSAVGLILYEWHTQTDHPSTEGGSPS